MAQDLMLGELDLGIDKAKAKVDELKKYLNRLKTDSVFSAKANRLKGLNSELNRLNSNVKRVTKSSQKFSGVMDEWWRRFGLVAIGFTIAYRAMNAFENILSRANDTIVTAIKETGELASTQAKYAMWLQITTKSAMGFNKAMAYSGQVIRALKKESLNSLSGLDELATGLDEMAQAGVLITPEMTGQLASLVDFTVMVAQTTGNIGRQIRQEIQALFTGKIRAESQLIRTAANFGIITKQDIQDLKHLVRQAEITEKVMTFISGHMEKVREVAIKSNIDVGLNKWSAAMRLAYTEAIDLSSAGLELGNVFGNVLYDHIEKVKKAMTDKAISRKANFMTILAWGFDKALSSMEALLVGIEYAVIGIWKLGETIKPVIEYVKSYSAEITVLSTAIASTVFLKALKLVASGIWSINRAILVTLAPVALATTALIAMVAAYRTLEEMAKWVTDKLKEYFEGALEVARSVYNWITGELIPLIERVTDIDIGEKGRLISDKFIGHFNDVLKESVAYVKKLYADIKAGAVDAVSAFNGMAKATVTGTEEAKKLLAEFKRLGKQDTALEKIKEALDKLTTTKAEREIRELNVQLSSFKDILKDWKPGDLGFEEMTRKVTEFEDEIRKLDRANWTFRESVKKGFDEYVKDIGTLSEQIEDSVVRAMKGAEDAIVDFVKTGKLAFEDFANAVIEDLMRIAIRQSITVPMATGFAAYFKHEGGPVGATSRVQMLPASTFDGAPRLHKGLESNEVPTILERGEFVLTAEQMAGRGGKTVVNVINNTGEKTSQRRTKSSGGMEQIDIIIGDAVAKNISGGKSVSKAIESTFGLARAGR